MQSLPCSVWKSKFCKSQQAPTLHHEAGLVPGIWTCKWTRPQRQNQMLFFGGRIDLKADQFWHRWMQDRASKSQAISNVFCFCARVARWELQDPCLYYIFWVLQILKMYRDLFYSYTFVMYSMYCLKYIYAEDICKQREYETYMHTVTYIYVYIKIR